MREQIRVGIDRLMEFGVTLETTRNAVNNAMRFLFDGCAYSNQDFDVLQSLSFAMLDEVDARSRT